MANHVHLVCVLPTNFPIGSSLQTETLIYGTKRKRHQGRA